MTESSTTPTGPGLTREALKRMSDAIHTSVSVSEPAQVLCDIDGVPMAVLPSRNIEALLGGVLITQGEADRLALTPDELARDFPHVRIMTNPKENQ